MNNKILYDLLSQRCPYGNLIAEYVLFLKYGNSYAYMPINLLIIQALQVHLRIKDNLKYTQCIKFSH